VNHELRWKELEVVDIKVPSWHLLGGTE